MKKIKFTFLMFLLAFSCLPVFIILLSVVIYSKLHEIAVNDEIYTIVVLGSILVILGIIVSFLTSRFLSSKIEKILRNLKDVFTLKEYAALEKGSALNAFNMVVNGFEYYREKRSGDEKIKNELAVLKGAGESSIDIIWRKPRDADYFRFEIPHCWKNTYAKFDLPERAILFDYLQEETLSQVKYAFSRAEEAEGREINIKSKIRVGGINSNEWAQVLIAGRSVKTSDGEIVLTGLVIDESRFRLLESRLKEYRLMYAFALQSAEDIIYENDIETDKFTVLNSNKWDETFGAALRNGTTSEVIRNYCESIEPDYKEGFMDRFFNHDHLALFPNKTMSYEYRMKNVNGDYIWVNHTVCAVGEDETQIFVDKAGGIPRKAVTKVIGRISDMNEQRQRKAREISRGFHDALTGAYLTSKLREEFNQAVEALSGEGAKYQPVLIVADADGFRLINDLHGREIGDKILLEIVLSFWENQTQFCSVARTGGDEFAMLVKELPENSGLESGDSPKAIEVAAKILNKFKDQVKVEGVAVNVSLSIGIAYYGSGGENFDEVYASARKALSAASAKGINMYEEYG